MSLDERIAKRKAEGWHLLCWVVKRMDREFGEQWLIGDDLANGRWGMDSVFAKRFGTMNHGGASSTAKGYPGAYVAPVFKRTIKVKRGHSFSWALARMKEGKRVRAGRWDKRCSLRLGDEFFYTFVGCDGQSRKYELLSYDAADTWELAE